MLFEVDVKDINPDSLISLLIKRIEELEKLQESYKEQVLKMEKAVRETLQRHNRYISDLQKQMGVSVRW